LFAVGVGDNPRESLSELAKLGAAVDHPARVEDEFDGDHRWREIDVRPVCGDL